MAVKMVMLLELESGTKRPKPTTPKNDALPMVLSAEPGHKSFGYSEVLIRLRDVLLGVVIRKCETLTTNISQQNGPGMITCQFVAYNWR